MGSMLEGAGLVAARELIRCVHLRRSDGDPWGILTCFLIDDKKAVLATEPFATAEEAMQA